MRRVYSMSALMFLAMLFFGMSAANGQSTSRRGEPNVLSTGYYVVDSDDDAPEPWRPNYFFVDTNYQPTTWKRISNGPRQFADPGYFFFNPAQLGPPPNYNGMDTANNSMAGPIYMNLARGFAFYNVVYDSIYVSSNGFVGFRPWLEAVGGSSFTISNSYFANTNVNLKTGFSGAPPAIIAALWADLDFITNKDTSRVYVRTSPSLDTFMVNYYNMRLRPGSPNNGVVGSGSDKIFIRKFQIVLAASDSSIQVNYGPFTGALNSFPPTLAWRLFQNNSSVGLVNETRSQATSVLYRAGTAADWHAKNINCPTCNKNFRQGGQYSLKFKQWKNVVRAVSVVTPTRNYEICLGEAPITPRATFMNVDNKTQTFKVRFQIRNVVTGIAVYGRAISLLNVAPGATKDTTFSPYATNPNILSQLGTFRACAIATTYDTLDVNIGDRWPFDDTICTRVFGVRRVTQPFVDASNLYSVTNVADIPDQQKWISIGAQVVDGEDATFDPPPPRDENGMGAHQYKSPVIRMDRQDIEGNTYTGSNVGDTLMSFPINLQGQTQAGLTFDYQRTGRSTTYPMFWDADVMFGPEHTVLNITNQVIRTGDSMTLEFKRPSEPGCNPSASGWVPIASVDGGHDFEFQKYFLRIESMNKLPTTNYFTPDFRFRLRLKAKYDGSPIPPPQDDNDEWYVDNLSVQVPRKPEIEVMWVRVVNPYTKIPASQAVSLPVYVKIANNSSNVSIAFPIRVQIIGADGETKYWYSATVNSIAGGTDSVIQMPNWNAQNASLGGGAEYTVHAWISQNGYDSYEEDNGTYTKFYLNVEQEGGLTQEFAYDDAGISPGTGAGNDVPAVTQTTGDGIGFNGASGSFAMKFRLVTKDTLFGIRAYFSSLSQSHDEIRLSVLEGTPESCTPGELLQQQGVTPWFEDERQGGFFDKFWPYYFPKPIVLPGGADAGATKGNYWVSVSQLGLDSYKLGGDISRGGAIVRVADPFTPTVLNLYRSKFGTQFAGGNGNNNGDVSCVWALEINASSGNWAGWMPSNGHWPFYSYGAAPYYIRNGSFTPMIRPLISRSVMLPIELVYLHGTEKNGAAVLTWATAKEVNNEGFFVERLDANNAEDQWMKIGFVSSKVTNSDKNTGYAYTDNKVAPGTYKYRLIQMDLDGTEKVTNTVTVGIISPEVYEVEQNYPNPFNPSTEIRYSLPVGGETKIEVYNTLGQLVRTLVNGYESAGRNKVRWDAKDDNGKEVAAGQYFYKFTSGDYSVTRKMTYSK